MEEDFKLFVNQSELRLIQRGIALLQSDVSLDKNGLVAQSPQQKEQFRILMIKLLSANQS